LRGGRGGPPRGWMAGAEGAEAGRGGRAGTNSGVCSGGGGCGSMVCLLVAGRGAGRREANWARLEDTAGAARGLPLLVWLTVETVRTLCCCLKCLGLDWDGGG
jgi:hypothetical protein